MKNLVQNSRLWNKLLLTNNTRVKVKTMRSLSFCKAHGISSDYISFKPEELIKSNHYASPVRDKSGSGGFGHGNSLLNPTPRIIRNATIMPRAYALLHTVHGTRMCNILINMQVNVVFMRTGFDTWRNKCFVLVFRSDISVHKLLIYIIVFIVMK